MPNPARGAYMKMLPGHTDQKIAWLLLFLLLVPSFAFAGVPLEVGLYKSSLLKLNKKMVLVTLANTRKDAKDKDAEIIAKSDKMDVEKRQDSGASNTNKFVTVEILSPYDLKIDGITIGSTSMIIWTKADGDEKPQPTFYDVKVTGDRSAIETQIKELASGDDITVQYAHDTVILSGAVAKEQTRGKIEKIAKAFSGKIINNIEISDPKQVLLEVKVAQVDKLALRDLGLNVLVKGNSGAGFSSSSGGTPGSSDSGGIIDTVRDITGLGGGLGTDGVQLGAVFYKAGIAATLQALATKGKAKMLAEPNLLIKSTPIKKDGSASGTTVGMASGTVGWDSCSAQEGYACFLAGKKYPISVLQNSNTGATTVETLDVGVKLKFHAEVLESGLISLIIAPASVSSIVGTIAVNGYPIIDTREVTTEVELKDGESLVMAGLLQEEAIKTMSKIPLLGDIPILGALFRSTHDEMNEKELVFFITPKIVKPMAKGEKTVLPTDKKLTQEQEDELKWMPLGR
jgi:pilus assembly protein CpaC